MYERIVLAYDSSIEGRSALREGALLAKRYEAQVFLLAVVADSPALHAADGLHPGVLFHQEDTARAVLEEGARRLRELGFQPVSKLVRGEPAQAIGAFARHVEASLVVVGHRRQSRFERWWSGSTGGYLMDHVGCSLLIARSTISDEQFELEMQALDIAVPANSQRGR